MTEMGISFELQICLGGMVGLDRDILESLQRMMDAYNPYANALIAMGEVFKRNPRANLKMVICENRAASR